MSSPFQPIELYGHQAICVCSRGIPETIKILIYAKWVQGPPMAPFRLSAERRRLQLDNWRSGFIEELYVRDWAGHIETARDCKRTLNWRWGPGGSNHIWAKGVSSKWLFKPGARGPPHLPTGAVNFGQGSQPAHSDPSEDSVRKKSPTSLPASCLLMLPIGQRSRSVLWVGRGRVERRLELVQLEFFTHPKGRKRIQSTENRSEGNSWKQ